MNKIFIFLVLFLLFSFMNSVEEYYLNIGIPLNITNIKNSTDYTLYTYLEYAYQIRVKIFVPNVSCLCDGLRIYIKESFHSFIKSIYVTEETTKKISNETYMILFYYNFEEPSSPGFRIHFTPEHNIDYMSFVFELEKHYDITLGINNNFTNILNMYYYNFFILGLENGQTINVIITLKSTEFLKLNDLLVKEYINKTGEYDYYISKKTPKYFLNKFEIDDINRIYTLNFTYYIDLFPNVAIMLSFSHEVHYLNIKVETRGRGIQFYDNETKIISNIKANENYYFFTNKVKYGQCLITLITKYSKNFPFYNLDIYSYYNDSNKYFKTGKGNSNLKVEKNEDKLIFRYFYKFYYFNILTDIAFLLVPEYDLDYIIASIDYKDFIYIFKDGDIKQFYNIYPESGMFFWINIKKFQKLNINITYSYSKTNPINYIDFYEYSDYYNKNKHINQLIIPETKDNNELFTSLSFMIENLDTNYAAIKINQKDILKNLELKINIIGKIYNLLNNIPINISNINSGESIYLNINATYYNVLFIKFIFKNENIAPFDYITINEYKENNNLTYIKSTKKLIDIQKSQNESIIELSYKPESLLCKYITLFIKTNSNIDYLISKVDIGGGYYEFYNHINISNIIKGTVYYFPIKLSIFQKIKINITLKETIIKPFTYANIYEKPNKENNYYYKYYNQTFINKKISGNLIEYFSYSIDNFNTNYIFISLIPNTNIDNIQIKYEISNSYYDLLNGESKNLFKIFQNIPYYFNIYSQQYQQININLTMNNLNDNPFDFIEIYEFSGQFSHKAYNKYINKSIDIINNNNNNLTNYVSYMFDSSLTNYIMIKILSKIGLDYLNIKINVGGGYYEMEKGIIKNVTNLILKYSYYFFVLSGKGEKLKYKLIINSNYTTKPFNTINALEYLNKNSPSIYLQNEKKEFHSEIKNNQLIIYMSYETKHISTNYIALKISPNYNLSSVECLIEQEIEDNKSSSFTIINILTIILVIIVIITTIIFIIYIKRIICNKTYSNSIEDFNINKNYENKNEKKFELALLPVDANSSIN